MKIRKHFPLSVFILAAILFRICWKLYTHFTFEDAFITFRFAKNLANGLGFVYNANEPVYGTTTPLFTILVAAWLRIFPDLPVVGASLFGLLAGLVSIVLAWKLLEELQVSRTHSIVAVGLLVLSDKFWIHDMGGMETSLVICAMAASYVLLVRDQPIWAGICAGLLLWVRMDGGFWICILVVAAWGITRKFPRIFVGITSLVYLPWLVFASLRFGSPIPDTVSAKWVAYHTIGLQPVWTRVQTLFSWLTPASLPTLSPQVLLWIAGTTMIFALIATLAYRGKKWMLVLPAFCLEEIARLIAMGATFEGRYFIPLLWALLILCGLGVGTVWDYLAQHWGRKNIVGFFAIVVYVCISLWFSVQMAQLERHTQIFVYDLSLKEIGVWLEENTPVSATVLLEPLGYAGYYADRYMMDEVGLIAPQVVDWKRAGYSTDQVISFLDPDYVVLHCDDALRVSDDFLSQYAQVALINPLGFSPGFQTKYDPNASEWVRRNDSRPRSACYQIWKR